MKENKYIKEVVFLIFMGAGILYLLALISYSELEHPFSGAMTIEQSTNYLGKVGSYIADFSLSIFGLSSYIIALSLMIIGGFIYTDKFAGFNSWIFVIKFFLFWFLIASTSAFFYSTTSEFASGWLGLEIDTLLKPLLGFGVNFIYIISIMILVSILSRSSWFEAFVLLYKCTKTLGFHIWNVMSKVTNKVQKIKVQKVAKKVAKNTRNSKKFTTIIPTKTIENLPIIRPKTTKKPQIIHSHKFLPTLDLLDKKPTNQLKFSETELQYMAEQVIEKLGDFSIEVTVEAITPGPVITSFEISIPSGVKASKIVGLDKDLARALLVESVRIIDVIPGKSTIGLEIPNKNRQMIGLSEIIDSPIYKHSNAPLTMCLGKDVAGNHIIMDLAKTPHLLVAGATGMGKSVGLNAMLMGILFKSSPKDVRLIMIDPKVVELAIYADIPHLLTPVVTDMNEAASSLFWCVGEMERRYTLMAKFSVRNIAGFNEKIIQSRTNGTPILDPNFDAASSAENAVADELEELPLIVIIIDEYADMLGALAQEDRAKSKRCESFIIRLAQKARAAGMHLIIATQRPSVDVITGLIKSNIPSRVAFKVSSKIDSRTILDKSGAEQLLGMGDMLYMMPGKSHLSRIHGAFVSDSEISRVVNDLKANYPTNYVNSIIKPIEEIGEVSGETTNESGELDPLYDEAVALVTSSGKVSISSVQRKLRIGYNRAARIVEDMETAGVVSSMNTSGNRQVLAPSPL